MPKKPVDSIIEENRRRILQLSGWDEFYEDVLLRTFRDPLNRDYIDDSFEPWLENFVASQVTIGGSARRTQALGIRTALQKTCQLDVTGTALLLFRVLTACYQAQHDSLPDRKRRKQHSECLDECPNQIKAAATIVKFMKHYPDACRDAWMGGGMPRLGCGPGYKVQITRGDEPLSITTLAGLLEFYATQLQKMVDGKKLVPGIHRVKTGPLLYPDRFSLVKQKAQPDTRVSGLLFELTLLFRLHTPPATIGYIWMSGSRMPTGGNPHFPLVTLLTNATLGKNLSVYDARSRVQSLVKKGVGLIGW